jgi:hypothetical protein
MGKLSCENFFASALAVVQLFFPRPKKFCDRDALP